MSTEKLLRLFVPLITVFCPTYYGILSAGVCENTRSSLQNRAGKSLYSPLWDYIRACGLASAPAARYSKTKAGRPDAQHCAHSSRAARSAAGDPAEHEKAAKMAEKARFLIEKSPFL